MDIYTIKKLDAGMTLDSASISFSAMTALDPEVEYIRLKDRSHNVVAFADYRLDVFLYAHGTNYVHYLDPPSIECPPWHAPLEALHEVAKGAVSTA